MHLLSAPCALLFTLLTFAQASRHDLRPARRSHIAKRQSAATYGLYEGAAKTSAGIYVGFHPDWSVADPPQLLEERVGKPPAVIGGYVHLNVENQTYSEIDGQIQTMLPMANTTIYSIAVIPLFTLDKWTDDMTNILASKMAVLNELGLTVWLRFAYEMNGNWMPYGLDPTNFVPTWQKITVAIRIVAPKTYMLWAPNVMPGVPPTVLQGYAPYYPGPTFVDLAAVDLYWLGLNSVNNTLPPTNDFINMMQTFYDAYSDAHPIVLAETSAPRHYIPEGALALLPQDRELPNGADGVDWSIQIPTTGDGSTEVDVKLGFFEQIASNATAAHFPKFLALIWFNLAKIGGPMGTPLLNDFRIVKLPNDTLTIAFREAVGSPVSAGTPSAQIVAVEHTTSSTTTTTKTISSSSESTPEHSSAPSSSTASPSAIVLKVGQNGAASSMRAEWALIAMSSIAVGVAVAGLL